jgi:hypothetical protein
LETPAREELIAYPAFRSRWVALYSGDLNALEEARPHYAVVLPSGVVVVDADTELDALCSRLRDENRTALEIIYNA